MCWRPSVLVRVDFFTEFPEEGELGKAELVDFPSTVYIAADSIDEFRRYEQELEEANSGVEPAYWPVVDNSYWISPFANTEDIEEVFDEVEGLDREVLIDLELPLLDKKLFFRNILSFRRNKRLIQEFLEGNDDGLMTAEHPGIPVIGCFMKLLGIVYSSEEYGHERCPLYYTSRIGSLWQGLTRKSIKRRAERGEVQAVGLGTIATGVYGDEPILSPEQLERDLEFLEEAGVERAVIFRLGGLEEDYLEVCRKFVD